MCVVMWNFTIRVRKIVQRAEGELNNPSSIVTTHYDTNIVQRFSAFIMNGMFLCLIKFLKLRLWKNSRVVNLITIVTKLFTFFPNVPVTASCSVVQKLVIQNENVELGAQSAVIGLLAGPLESEKYPIVVNMFCKIQSSTALVP
jgi:hypothetical protein